MKDLQGCQTCPRLVAFRRAQQKKYPGYHNKPVEMFGSRHARLLVTGLAPGLHGANATGRPFTGDASGDFLFEYLHRFGFATNSVSRRADDGLLLTDCRITNAVKCLPPQNKPISNEINSCNRYLQQEIRSMPAGSVLLALGGIAHRAIIKALDLRQSRYRFGHQAEYELPAKQRLVDSFHCSRYMLQTRKLTPEMFEAVFVRIRQILG